MEGRGELRWPGEREGGKEGGREGGREEGRKGGRKREYSCYYFVDK